MPHKSRIDATGAVHHLMARGIERRVLFHDDGDRDDFLRRLSAILKETGTPCYAGTLIPNHVHLLLKTGRAPLSQVMRRLLTVSFNRRPTRFGHLFRSTSILCEEDSYVRELVRSMHLNPVRARLVTDAWMISVTADTVHSWAGGKTTGRTQTASFHHAGSRTTTLSSLCGERAAHDLTGGGLIRSSGWLNVKAMREERSIRKSDERIPGNGRFVPQALREAGERMERRYRLYTEGMDLESVMKRVCAVMGIERQQLYARGKERKEGECPQPPLLLGCTSIRPSSGSSGPTAGSFPCRRHAFCPTRRAARTTTRVSACSADQG